MGFLTGLMGRNAIWICTDAVETTVLNHLEWQLEYLAPRDKDVHDAVLCIKADEISHRDFGTANRTRSILYKPPNWLVSSTTKFAIWLSTKL